MNVFIASLILQGIIRKPELEIYVATDEFLARPTFNKIITANRFQILLKILHSETDQGSDTALKKIWSFIEVLLSSFKSLYKPRRILNVDDTLYLCKGRLS